VSLDNITNAFIANAVAMNGRRGKQSLPRFGMQEVCKSHHGSFSADNCRHSGIPEIPRSSA
jgi:hypothetical protein